MTRILSVVLWVIVMSAFALLVPSATQATTLMQVSLEEVTDAADVIVAGTVIRSEGKYDPRFDLVFTHATIRVEEVLEGETGEQTVEVIVPGGVDGDLWTQVHGAPEPGDEGQQVIVFLYKNRGTNMSNVVFWQGLYHIDADRIRQTGEPAGQFLSRVKEIVLRQKLQDEDPFSSQETDGEGREVRR